MSEIDDIPADEEVVLTASMDRAFKMLGCDPTCHCCENKIDIGDTFQLACVDDEDEMLCGNCTPKKLKSRRKKAKKLEEERRAAFYHPINVGHSRSYGGFSRPHIAHKEQSE